MQTWAISGNSGQLTMTIRVLFVCHGNICRSPMAEFIFKNIVSNAALSERFKINSAATSREEIWNGQGNPIYPPAAEQLIKNNVPFDDHRAVQVTARDYENYDYIIYMDRNNERNLKRITGGDPLNKCFRLLDFTEHPGDVSDPWYTGDFDQTYRDLLDGCRGLLRYILSKSAQ